MHPSTDNPFNPQNKLWHAEPTKKPDQQSVPTAPELPAAFRERAHTPSGKLIISKLIHHFQIIHAGLGSRSGPEPAACREAVPPPGWRIECILMFFKQNNSRTFKLLPADYGPSEINHLYSRTKPHKLSPAVFPARFPARPGISWDHHQKGVRARRTLIMINQLI